MNALYNVRCAPPVTLNQAEGPQVLSLCQADSCPMTEPNPDSAACVSLTANGAVGVQHLRNHLHPPYPSLQYTYHSFRQRRPPQALVLLQLEHGAIFGIAIRCLVFLILLVNVAMLLRKRGKSKVMPIPPQSSVPVLDKHASYAKYGQTVSELGSPQVDPGSPDMNLHSPVEIGGHGWSRMK